MPQRPATSHPVRKLGSVPYRSTPILSLAFIQAAARAEIEVDLAALPPLISGGDRKARRKAINEQRSAFRVPRRIERQPWADPAYGSLACWCRHCNHLMLIDDNPDEVFAVGLTCDRCRCSAF